MHNTTDVAHTCFLSYSHHDFNSFTIYLETKLVTWGVLHSSPVTPFTHLNYDICCSISYYNILVCKITLMLSAFTSESRINKKCIISPVGVIF